MDTDYNPFFEAFDWVIDAEKGYVNDPEDPGGATNRGVSLRAVRFRDVDLDGKLDFDLDRDGDVDAEDIKLLSLDDARRFFREDYWSLKGAGASNKLSCDSLPRRWAITVFDAAILQGPRTAVALMQRACEVKDDGILGPKTIDVVRTLPEQDTLARFAQHRLARMRKHPKADRYLDGWTWRIVLLHERIYASPVKEKV